MKYILFEKSAVELMINNPALQSMEFPASEKFVNFLREKFCVDHLLFSLKFPIIVGGFLKKI